MQGSAGVQGVGLTKSNDVRFLQPIQHKSFPGGASTAPAPRQVSISREDPAARLSRPKGSEGRHMSDAGDDATPGPVAALAHAERAMQEATAATAAWVMNDADGTMSDSGVPATPLLTNACIGTPSSLASIAAVLVRWCMMCRMHGSGLRPGVSV